MLREGFGSLGIRGSLYADFNAGEISRNLTGITTGTRSTAIELAGSEGEQLSTRENSWLPVLVHTCVH